MKTISDMYRMVKPEFYTPSQYINFNSYVGLEFEVENVAYKDSLKSRYWRAEDDGSLRNGGLEFVFSQPFRGKDIEDAVDNLIESVVTGEISERTSFHVHIDVRELTYIQVLNFFSLFLIFEKTLIKYLDNRREENIFCLPYYVNDDHSLSLLQSAYNNETNFNRFINNCHKYSTLNLFSIRKFGSIEARLHHLTFNKDEIFNWINILLAIKNFVQGSEDMIKFPSVFSGFGFKKFSKRVFESQFEHLENVYDDRDIMSGIRFLQYLMY